MFPQPIPSSVRNKITQWCRTKTKTIKYKTKPWGRKKKKKVTQHLFDSNQAAKLWIQLVDAVNALLGMYSTEGGAENYQMEEGEQTIDASLVSTGMIVVPTTGSTAITSIVNGYVGQKMTFLYQSGGSRANIAGGSGIILGVDGAWSNQNGNLTLMYTGSRWEEISRMNIN
jgi:hypothetical protein